MKWILMFDDFGKFTQIFTKMDGGLGAPTFLWLFCYRSINRPAEKGPSSSPYGSCVGCYLLTILALMLWKWIIEELRGWNVHCFYADSMNRWPHPTGNIGWGNLPRIDLNSFLDAKNSGCQRQKWDLYELFALSTTTPAQANEEFFDLWRERH